MSFSKFTKVDSPITEILSYFDKKVKSNNLLVILKSKSLSGRKQVGYTWIGLFCTAMQWQGINPSIKSNQISLSDS